MPGGSQANTGQQSGGGGGGMGGGGGGMGSMWGMFGAIPKWAGLAGQKRGRRPALHPEEQKQIQKKGKVFNKLYKMFKTQAGDPYRFKMRLGEQEMYDERARDIYGADRDKQRQSLMADMNRSGSLSSGATNYALTQFSRDTLKDYQQFYFQDRSRAKSEAQDVQNTLFKQGDALIHSKNPWERLTTVKTARDAQHNKFRNRSHSTAHQTGSAMVGSSMGGQYGSQGSYQG